MEAYGAPLTDRQARVYVAGHRGLVGSAVVRELKRRGYTNLLLRAHAELDLTDKHAVQRLFEHEKPQFVVLAAAKVGGILANSSYPADFIRNNIDIQNSVIEASYRNGVERLLFLGSSCIYPKLCPQPIREEYLLTGPLEATNRPYAVAKIAGIEMCWSYNRQYGTRYLAAMPTNLFGPDDNFDLKTSHVLPALLLKAHAAKLNGDSRMTVWGTGKPRREFLHADDAARACIFLLELEKSKLDGLLRQEAAPLINIGSGEDLTIRELAEMVARVVGFEGALVFDADKPDGTPRKLLDVGRIHELGWRHVIELEDGLRSTYGAVKDKF